MTGFIIFDNQNAEVSHFLDFWHLHNLIYTTQDQITFPFVVFKTNVYPYTLPDGEINGNAHSGTWFYRKWDHGHRMLGFPAGNNSNDKISDFDTTRTVNTVEAMNSELEDVDE